MPAATTGTAAVLGITAEELNDAVALARDIPQLIDDVDYIRSNTYKLEDIFQYVDRMGFYNLSDYLKDIDARVCSIEMRLMQLGNSLDAIQRYAEDAVVDPADRMQRMLFNISEECEAK